ncbi:40S ribosomal protein S2-1 [Tritrichomonas foetus]|uniref:Small ribosomal subunit protein uS5 n=1 Tax=Tritrichomonas foetus TaxID=1144522 RepID=A0A1J4KIL1_9EUKA|nr:40S ribosomal protein S2-1 [Tritrichomonas foetus]OHT10768.1 40S ribosomal protein S2-1 [Tritrichomonas foetus]|eukprot:OHT10768.1 40S ribosomal protein S2-1 [Tritrichomonas foetus]
MSEAPTQLEGEQRRGGMRGRRDNQRGGRRPGPQRGGDKGKDKWQPRTKLGRLVSTGRITTIEEIYLHAIPIKEPEIVDHLLGDKLKDEVMKIMPVQKQTRAGQRTRFKACIAVGDGEGHIGLGIKTAAEVANAIKGAMIYAKLSILPVRRGYWGNKIGQPHTVPNTVTGKCGSIRMRLIPAPRGSGIVAGSVAKKLLGMAGFEDVFTSSIGHTKTTFNFLVATYKAIEATYQFLTPDQWDRQEPPMHPFVEHSEMLSQSIEQKVHRVDINLQGQ